MTVAQTKAARRKANQDPRWRKQKGRLSAEKAAAKRAAFMEGRRK